MTAKGTGLIEDYMSVGFDNYVANHNLLLAMPFREMVGGVGAAANGELVHDRASPHLGTLSINGTGAMNWGQAASGFPFLEFVPTLGVPANWTWVEILAAAAADLDFTTEDFSLLAWVYLDNLAAGHTIFCYGAQGVAGGGGYQMNVSLATPARLFFGTCQAGAIQSTFSAALISAGAWYLVGATRNGIVGKTYINGQDWTDGPEDHVDPATQTEPFHIGVRQIQTTGVGIDYDTPFEGYIAYPRVWDRCLTSEIMLEIWNNERHWFNV
jgi:hypothetical protein